MGNMNKGLVASKEDLSDDKAKIYLLDEEVVLGGTFVIDAAAAGKTRLESTTFVFVPGIVLLAM